MRLILARHGETDANRAGREQGGDSMPLNATGRGQAEDLTRALAVELPLHLYSSPVRRARETAEIVSKTHVVSFTVLDDLVEIDVSALDGLTDREMRQRYPEFAGEWLKDASAARLPGGETMQEVQDRAWRSIRGLLDEHADETAVVVSHYSTVMTVLARVLDMPLRHFGRLRLDLGAIARLEVTPDETRVLSTNETWHLRQPGHAPDGD